MKVQDRSLFEACLTPGATHEGVSRGYIEGVPPDNEFIAIKKFFIHSSCKAAAEAKFEEIFRDEWARRQPALKAMWDGDDGVTVFNLSQDSDFQ